MTFHTSRGATILGASLAASWLLVACGAPGPGDVGARLHCAAGYHDDGGVCVPEACGVGPWGDLPVDQATVHVDASAAEGGDGTAAYPLRGIQAALDLAGDRGGGLVAVAAGTYRETLWLSEAHGEVHLAGRCRELVTLDASAGEEATQGIVFHTRYEAAVMSDIAVQGAHDGGVLVGSGQIELERVEISGCAGAGVWVICGALGTSSEVDIIDSDVHDNAPYGMLIGDGSSLVRLRDSTIRDTHPVDGDHGYGVVVFDGGSLVADACRFQGNTSLGVWVRESGSSVVLRDSSILDTFWEADGRFGHGVEVMLGASATLDGCEVRGNAASAVSAFGSGTELTVLDSVIRDTQPNGNGDFGHALVTDSGARLLLERCRLERFGNNGITLHDEATEAVVRDCVIRDSQFSGSGWGGYGVQIGDGAELRASRCRILQAVTIGVLAEGEGVHVSLDDCEVRDTRYGIATTGGYGVQANDGAFLELRGCALSNNHGVGLLVANEGTVVVAHDTVIAQTGAGWDQCNVAGVGLEVQFGASVECSSLVTEDNEGPGLLATGEGTRLCCDGCLLSRDEFAGAVALADSTLELSSTVISGVEQSVDIGGGAGVYAAAQAGIAPPSLSLVGCTITDSPAAGVWLAGGGDYQLIDNLIEDSLGVEFGTGLRCGDGVYARSVSAWDGRSGLVLSGNTLRGHEGAGVLLDDASAALPGNHWSDNSPDLLVQGDACLTPRDDYAEVPRVEICPVWDRPVCDLYFGMGLGTAGIDPGRPQPSAHSVITAGPRPPRRPSWKPATHPQPLVRGAADH